MRAHRLFAVARKEVIQIMRDGRSLGIVLILPIAMTLLFGYGVTLDINHIKTCVLNHDGSPASWDFVGHEPRDRNRLAKLHVPCCVTEL